MEVVFTKKEKTHNEKYNDKIDSFAGKLAIYFKRIGKDENGNPLFEANKFAILDIIGKYSSSFLFTENADWFYKITEHTFIIQSYSLSTDLRSMAENIINGKFKHFR